VLFLTRGGAYYKIVGDDGSLGDMVDFNDLERVKTCMRGSQPAMQV